MADKKITGLPELTAVAADDYLEIVETSTNTNKKISRETLAGWYFLTTGLTTTSWNDGSLRSTIPKTLIDMSTEFGVPAGVKAVRLKVAIRDSGSASSTCLFQLSGISTGDLYSFSLIASEINNRLVYAAPVVPCDENGDLYYSITASGAGTMSVYMSVWGYWL